jgi:hypothetical protein
MSTQQGGFKIIVDGLELYLDASNTKSYSDTRIGSTKVYTKTLTQEQITQNYNSVKTRYDL